jgi:hypothetical protein
MGDITAGAEYSYSFEKGTYATKGYGVCAGLGAMTCDELATIKVGPSFGINVDKGASLTRKSEYSATMTYTFSYSTSEQTSLAGRASTMFLIPSLNIVFSKSLKVEYSVKTCMATGTEVTSWSLIGNKNFKVCLLRFVSVS